MAYKNYHELAADVEYNIELSDNGDKNFYAHRRRSYEEIPQVFIKRVTKAWSERIKEKYEETTKTNTVIGKFISKYSLPLKEFLCLINIMGNSGSSGFLIFDDCDDEDELLKHKIRYESSMLKRHKLVFKIVDPMSPIKSKYQVSYKAQMELTNKKYTEEYQLLDMGLEEDAKRNSPDALDSLYYTIEPKLSFSDLIVKDKTKQDLMAAVSRETQKDKIFKEWGLKNSIQYGKGVTLNFRGPPGTGKTMAAHCLAKELKKKLLMVRYDQLQNMYVGETEKHIQRVFKIAKAKNAVLFFDEADAIANERSNMRMSWEMSQVNTLLKELERYEGVCIFATNFSEKYDKAFERRLTMHIDFDLPTKEQAVAILDKILHKKSRDINLSLAGLNIEGLSGGDLKNVVLNAAGFAANAQAPKIQRIHLEEAILSVRNAKNCNKRKNMNYLS